MEQPCSFLGFGVPPTPCPVFVSSTCAMTRGIRGIPRGLGHQTGLGFQGEAAPSSS